MSKFTQWTIVILSIQTAIMGIAISRLCYRLGYEQGKVAALTTFTEDNIGTCFVKGGCK